MLTPNDIRKKALRQYKDFLRAVLQRKPFFPLSIKGNKGKATAPLDVLFPQLRRLLEGAKEKIGYGYTVTLKTVNTRHAGEISMPDDIFFANVEDYLKFIDKEAEFLQFRKAIRATQRQVPDLLVALQEKPGLVIKHLAIWEDLLKVIAFFQKNPNPQQYSRALEIDVPATFVEDNEAIIETLVKMILPGHLIPKGGLGLKKEEILVLFRALDSGVFPDLSDNLQQFGLPLSLSKTIKINAFKIFIITDQINFLRFPNHSDSIAIFGDKVVLEQLAEMTWLKNKNLYFWGDISMSDFERLAYMRKHFSNIQPFLMDKKTYHQYQDLAINDKVFIENVTLLQQEEYELFLELKEKGKKLEQQHIRQVYLKSYLLK